MGGAKQRKAAIAAVKPWNVDMKKPKKPIPRRRREPLDLWSHGMGWIFYKGNYIGERDAGEVVDALNRHHVKLKRKKE